MDTAKYKGASVHCQRTSFDIWRLSHNLNIYNCYIYREANRTTDCIDKKGIGNTNLNIQYCGVSLNGLCNFPYS